MTGGPRSIHIAMSVSVDRFDDAYIRKHILPTFRDALGCRTPRDVRQQCELARRKGYEVFPPCDDVDERGRCKGHPVEPEATDG